MRKRPSKRRVKARLMLSRIVPYRDVKLHNLDPWLLDLSGSYAIIWDAMRQTIQVGDAPRTFRWHRDAPQ